MECTCNFPEPEVQGGSYSIIPWFVMYNKVSFCDDLICSAACHSDTQRPIRLDTLLSLTVSTLNLLLPPQHWVICQYGE